MKLTNTLQDSKTIDILKQDQCVGRNEHRQPNIDVSKDANRTDRNGFGHNHEVDNSIRREESLTTAGFTPEIIRLSEKAKQQLLHLRRKTGIDRWNILCRWAFCLSLSEPSKPQDIDIKLDSNVEIIWRVFTGAGSRRFITHC